MAETAMVMMIPIATTITGYLTMKAIVLKNKDFDRDVATLSSKATFLAPIWVAMVIRSSSCLSISYSRVKVTVDHINYKIHNQDDD